MAFIRDVLETRMSAANKKINKQKFQKMLFFYTENYINIFEKNVK